MLKQGCSHCSSEAMQCQDAQEDFLQTITVLDPEPKTCRWPVRAGVEVANLIIIWQSYNMRFLHLYVLIFHLENDFFWNASEVNWGADSTLSNLSQKVSSEKEVSFFIFSILFWVLFYLFLISIEYSLFSIFYFLFYFFLSVFVCKQISHLQMTTISWPVNPFLYATGTQLGRNPNVTVPCAGAVASPDLRNCWLHVLWLSILDNLEMA